MWGRQLPILLPFQTPTASLEDDTEPLKMLA